MQKKVLAKWAARKIVEKSKNFHADWSPKQLVRNGDTIVCLSSKGWGVTLATTYAERILRVMELLEGRWAIQILAAMREGPVRLSELKRNNPFASKKALTARLRWLESAGVVVRRDLSTSVLHVEYKFSDEMRQPLIALLDHLERLGKFYEERVQLFSD